MRKPLSRRSLLLGGEKMISAGRASAIRSPLVLSELYDALGCEVFMSSIFFKKRRLKTYNARSVR